MIKKILEWIARRGRLMAMRNVWREEWRARFGTDPTIYRGMRRIHPRSGLRYEALSPHGTWESVDYTPGGLVEFVDIYGTAI